MSADRDALWGDKCLPAILAALGKSTDDIKGVVLHFEYGRVATATFTDRYGKLTVEPLRIFGLAEAPALGTPRALQAVTLYVAEGNFVTIDCRYFPLGASGDDIVALLKAASL